MLRTGSTIGRDDPFGLHLRSAAMWTYHFNRAVMAKHDLLPFYDPPRAIPEKYYAVGGVDGADGLAG